MLRDFLVGLVKIPAVLIRRVPGSQEWWSLSSVCVAILHFDPSKLKAPHEIPSLR